MLYYILLVYVIALTSRKILQILYSIFDKIFQEEINISQTIEQVLSETTVIYPIFNEDGKVFESVVQAAVKIKKEYPEIEIIMVDDGSDNYEENKPLFDRAVKTGISVLRKNNEGKRVAQVYAFDRSRGRYIVTVDSDTIIESEYIYELIKPIINDSKVGAVTGNLEVKNKNTNWLTRMYSYRNWFAFNLERSAQSFTGSMMCCSGPFSVYTRKVFESVKHKYINQIFLGRKCTFGDDRHLTNLVFSQGYNVLFSPTAKAYTFSPENSLDYINQQTRWGKSFFREIFWTIRYAKNISLYSLFDTCIQPLIFILFGLNLVLNLQNFVVTQNFYFPLVFLIWIAFSSLIHIAYAIYITRDFGYLGYIFYSFYHFFLVIPIKLRSILTIRDSGWGTRIIKSANEKMREIFIWIWIYWFLIGFFAVFSAILTNQVVNSYQFNFYFYVDSFSIEKYVAALIDTWSIVGPVVIFFIAIILISTFYDKFYKIKSIIEH